MVPVGVREVVEAVVLGVERAGGDLVQQRLPDVDAVALDQRRLDDGRGGEASPRRRHELEAAGAAADHDDAVGNGARHGGRMARRGGRANRRRRAAVEPARFLRNMQGPSEAKEPECAVYTISRFRRSAARYAWCWRRRRSRSSWSRSGRGSAGWTSCG